MLKSTISLTIFLLLINSCQSTTLKSIDTLFLSGLFTPGTQFNTIKNGYSKELLTGDASKDQLEIIPAYFEEQCISECLKNSYCIRYTFNLTSNTCTLRSIGVKRKLSYDQDTLDKIRLELGLDLDKCSNGIYCLISESNSQPVCDPTLSSGPNCEYPIKYTYSQWSTWSECSQPCEGGITKRTRSCLKNSFDITQNKQISEQVADTFCAEEGSSFELKECNTQACGLFTQWSEWSQCSTFCVGLRTRKRDCMNTAPAEYCDPMYLKETEPCGNDCSVLALKLANPALESNTTAILLAGVIQFINSKIPSAIRILTDKNTNEAVERIGQVACNEFGFNGLNWAKAKEFSDLKQFKTESEFNKYVKENTYNGLECNGDETSIKDCQFKSNAIFGTAQYEIEVDCLVNGYWSEWSEWSACSTTCGAGIRQRQRFCTNPSPSQSAVKSGLPCPGRASEKQQCTMQRCKAPVGPAPAASSI